MSAGTLAGQRGRHAMRRGGWVRFAATAETVTLRTWGRLCDAVSRTHGRRRRRGTIKVIDGTGWRERTDDIAAAVAADKIRLDALESKLAEMLDIIEDAFEAAGMAATDRPSPRRLTLVRNPPHSRQAGA